MTTNWNFELLYKSDNDPRINIDIQESKEKIEEFIKKWKSNKEYTKEPSVLFKALVEYEKIIETCGILAKPLYYFSLKSELDQSNSTYKAKLSELESQAIKLGNELEFFNINISKISKNKQKSFLEYPPLLPYKHLLETSFLSGKYVLSEKEEKIINLMHKTSFSNWTEMTEEFLNKQTAFVLNENKQRRKANFNELFSLASSVNKQIRDSAGKQVHRITKKFAELATHELNSILEYKKVSDELRGFKYPESSRLLSDDIDKDMIDSLVEVVTENFNLSSRYYKLKAKLLGQEKLAYHERNVPIGKIEKKYTFEEAQKAVLQMYERISPHFKEVAEKFFEQGRIDVFPKKGKNGGAYCTFSRHIFPSFILLNFNERLNDVETIAHELGHGINHTLTTGNESGLNDHHSMATAEVASTFFEDFVIEQESQKLSEQNQVPMQMEKLNSDISSIFRQIALYKFERELHQSYREKGYLSTKDIGKLFKKHMSAYMGEYVTQDKGCENWWVYWSHIRSFFYVYSYASGLLISKSMQRLYKEHKINEIDIEKFLSTGSSKSPKEIFLELGIDISKKEFWEEGMKEINDRLTEIENLINNK